MAKKTDSKTETVLKPTYTQHYSNGSIHEHYENGAQFLLAPDWDVRLKHLKVSLSLVDEDRKSNIANLLRSEYGWSDAKLAYWLDIAVKNQTKTRLRSEAQKKRWKILERDRFTCQYCGKKAPDVILNVDHMTPLSKGGDNRDTNLITSCFDCNIGKGTDETSRT